jgi:tight adherence protein C
VLRRSGLDAYARIALYWSGDAPAPHEAEEEQSFTERLILPLFANASKVAGTLLPRSWLERIDRQIVYAGNPLQLTADRFVMLCAFTGFGIPGAYLLLALSTGKFDRIALLLIGIMVAMGVYFPWFWLRMRVNRRQSMISDALPDAMDLLTVSVEAGLGLEGALARVADKIGGPLGQELQRMLADMSLGTRRRDALRRLAARTNAPGLDTLVGALIQADQMGMSLGNVLRAQSDQLRTKRRQLAEERAMKAPLKMLFPMVLFILPTVFIVVLAPALMKMFEGLKVNGIF